MPRSSSTDQREQDPDRASEWQLVAGRSLVSSIRRDRGVAIVIAVFIVMVATMVGFTARSISDERNVPVIVSVTARQRTLVERYIKDVLLAVDGVQADPQQSAEALRSTATVLLDGGTVAGLQGSLDSTVKIPAVRGESARVKLEAARDRIGQLLATGDRILAAGASGASAADIQNLRILAAQLSSLTSDAAGAVTTDARSKLDRLVVIELVLGAASIVAAIAMGLFLRRAGARHSARFRSLVHNASDLISVVSVEGRLEYQSPSVSGVLGRIPSQVERRPFAELVHPDDQTVLAEALRIPSGETTPLRVRLQHADGSWRSTEGSVTNLLEDASVCGVVINLRDVTERDQAASDLAGARDAAMSASVMKSQFLASMSHEIRTPMNAVIGLSDLLLGTDLDTAQREYASGVYRAGEGLLAIINDILDFSKVEAGKVQLELVDVDITVLAEEVVALLGETANSKGIELLVHASPAVPASVRADPTRLRQIIVNLVSNAVKFTTTGEVVVRMRVDDTTTVPGKVVVRCEVQDSGIGIPEDVRATIFEPFSQADVSTTRRFGGTGLGLAIVSQLVELMGGRLGVDSTVGEGSTFWFVIPFEPSSAATVEARAIALDALSGARALVVDDNATNRVICREQLTSWGVSVQDVADGPSAILEAQRAAMRGLAYDFIVLDLNMPDLDGLEVADALRNEPLTANSRLFLLSSSGRMARETVIRHGLAGALTKPVRRSDFYNCLIEGMADSKDPTADRAVIPTAISVAPIGRRMGPAAFTGRALLVEDNATNRLVAGSMLARLGLDVDHAGDGVEALEILHAKQERGDRYDVIFMDCQMPRMDGYETTRQIRIDEADLRHIPIIAMTAAAMDGDREECLAAGMDDYVSKPIRPDAIAAALRRCAPDVEREGADGGDIDSSDADATVGDDVIIDLARIELLRGLDLDEGAVMATVIEQYLSDVEKRLEDLGLLAFSGDMTGVAAVAHTMKGASANVGASDVAKHCARLERTVTTRDRDLIATEIEQIREAVRRVRPTLDQLAHSNK